MAHVSGPFSAAPAGQPQQAIKAATVQNKQVHSESPSATKTACQQFLLGSPRHLASGGGGGRGQVLAIITQPLEAAAWSNLNLA